VVINKNAFVGLIKTWAMLFLFLFVLLSLVILNRFLIIQLLEL